MISWPGNQACQDKSSITGDSILIIAGATKNETSEVILKFMTKGTIDEYEKKVAVTKVFTTEEEKPKFLVEALPNSKDIEDNKV